MTTTHQEVACGVVARWAEPHRHDQQTSCTECGERLVAGVIECPECGQRSSTVTGMLATVIETASGGRRLVVSRRAPTGSWTPCRVFAATDEAVRVLRRAAADSAKYTAARANRGALA